MESVKYLLLSMALILSAADARCQNTVPLPADPCEKLDTNTIKKMITGTWIDVKDTTHILLITDDSVEETILITLDGKPSLNQSFWNYTFTDNIFSTDAVTCYSLVEYKPDYNRQVKVAINSITPTYLRLGASGKMIYRRKQGK